MMKPDEYRPSKTLGPVLLALIVAVLAATLLAGQVAEAKHTGRL